MTARSWTDSDIPSPRGGRQTWTPVQHRRFHKEPGPLAIAPVLPTIRSQHLPDFNYSVVKSEYTSAQHAAVPRSQSAMDMYKLSSSLRNTRIPSSSQAPREERPVLHSFVYQGSDIEYTGGADSQSPPQTATNRRRVAQRTALSYPVILGEAPQPEMDPAEQVDSKPEMSGSEESRKETNTSESPSYSTLLEQFADNYDPASEVSSSNVHPSSELISVLCGGDVPSPHSKPYLLLARDDCAFCETFPAPPETIAYLKSDATFLEGMNNPSTSRGLVISGNDKLYIGEPASLVSGILGVIKEGSARFSQTYPEDRIHVLSYIVGRHAKIEGGGLVGSVSDMLRSLSVQLLAIFGDGLDLTSDHLNVEDVEDVIEVLWAFMTLLTSVACRTNPRGRTDKQQPKATRLVIIVDGVNFLENGTPESQAEYQHFLGELDGLVTFINEGEDTGDPDPLQEHWESKGQGDRWEEYAAHEKWETECTQKYLQLKYVLIHPQISEWEPGKYGGSVILPRPPGESVKL